MLTVETIARYRGRLVLAQEGRVPGAPRAGLIMGGAVVAVVMGLTLHAGVQGFAQSTINGLVSGVLIALAAIGLTLIFGVMRLVNFAHGELLTIGAYVALATKSWFGLPLLAAGVVAMITVGVVGGLLEVGLWRPLRRKGAGLPQLLIMSLGLAFVLQYSLEFIASPRPRAMGANMTSTVAVAGIRVGTTQLLVVGVSALLLVAFGAALKLSPTGKRMRALADNFALAETTGIDAGRVVLWTWVVAGALTGLAGVLYGAAAGVVTPTMGADILLSLFAAVILGGLGNAYGAVAGGILIGITQEWSTLVIDSRWKLAVGFGVLAVTLIFRPHGLFGVRRRTF